MSHRQTNLTVVINFFSVMYKIMITLAAFGTLQARLNKSWEANFVLRITRSREGPISSNSTLGVFVPDFFSRIL